jgi:hypothetical protein
MPMMAVSRNSRFLITRFHIGTHHRCRVAKGSLHLYDKVNALDRSVKRFRMFYLLKHLLLLIIVIFKIKCNNLFFNEIMILNTLYVCLHPFSFHRESPDLDPERRTPHF